MTSINDYLPREVLVKIFSYYMKSEGPVKFLRNISPVCKLWNDLCPIYSLWKEVSWKSMKWNSDHLLKLGERGFLTSTHTLNLSCVDLTKEKPKRFLSVLPRLKFEDFFKLIDCCRNLKVLDVSFVDFLIETTLQFIERKFPFFMDSVIYKDDPKYKHSRMVPIDDGSKMIPRHVFMDIWIERYVDLRSRFGHYGRIISKIAESSPLLEELHFHDVRVDNMRLRLIFPVGEIQRRCPKLRVLEISNFKLDWSNYKDSEGFKEIRSFSAKQCDFSGHGVSKILKSSAKLEDLYLSGLRDVELAHLNEIPSEKVKILEISRWNRHIESVENAVRKWRLTLRKFTSYTCYHHDFTGVLKALVQDNPNPVIEEIFVSSYVNVQFMKSLIRNCPKLRCLLYCNGYYANSRMRGIGFITRDSLEDYSES